MVQAESGEIPLFDQQRDGTAEDRSLVDAFYQAALAAGGRDNGAPGIRQHYHSNYYAAYVLDPDGVNVEVVCQTCI